MKPPLEQNYYELLEVPRDATTAELDRAYDRARAYYGAGSVAVYSLTTPDELKMVQDRIDEAYLVLGDEKARLEYDARIGPPSPDERPLHREVRLARERDAAKEAEAKVRAEAEAKARAEKEAQAESEARGEAEALAELAGKSSAAPTEPAAATPSDSAKVEGSASEAASPPGETGPEAPPARPVTPPSPPPAIPRTATPAPEIRVDMAAVRAEERREMGPMPPPSMEFPEPSPRSAALNRREGKLPEPRPAPKPNDLPSDVVFNGEFLRRLRENLGMSVQELSDKTKIGKSHLENIEADKYASLPPQVYLRGFLMSYARELRLDPLRVAKSYLELQAAKGAGKARS